MDVEIYYDGAGDVVVNPTAIDAGFNSGVMIRWKNIGAYELDIVKFGTGGNWARLDVLSPGEVTVTGSTAEGPWCTYDFGGSYSIGGLASSTFTGALTLSCSVF